MAEPKESPTNLHDEDWYEGFNFAAGELAAHLRQGDLLPGGVLHDDTDAGHLLKAELHEGPCDGRVDDNARGQAAAIDPLIEVSS